MVSKYSHEHSSSRKINKLLTHKNNLPISIVGPINDLTVRGLYEKGFLFNDFLPHGVKLGYADYFDMVSADFDKGTIMLPNERSKHISLLPYSLFHAITRATFYQDDGFKQKSALAHEIVKSKLSYLRGYGYIHHPRSLLEKDVEQDAWQVVCEEERLVTLKAIEMIAQLALPPGRINALPQIESVVQFEKMVNSYGIKRTRQQVEIDPHKALKRVGFSMTVTSQEIQQVLDEVGNSNFLFS